MATICADVWVVAIPMVASLIAYVRGHPKAITHGIASPATVLVAFNKVARQITYDPESSVKKEIVVFDGEPGKPMINSACNQPNKRDRSSTNPGSGSGSGSGGRSVILREGPPSHICSDVCSKLCSGFWCSPNPSGTNPDFSSPPLLLETTALEATAAVATMEAASHLQTICLVSLTYQLQLTAAEFLLERSASPLPPLFTATGDPEEVSARPAPPASALASILTSPPLASGSLLSVHQVRHAPQAPPGLSWEALSSKPPSRRALAHPGSPKRCQNLILPSPSLCQRVAVSTYMRNCLGSPDSMYVQVWENGILVCDSGNGIWWASDQSVYRMDCAGKAKVSVTDNGSELTYNSDDGYSITGKNYKRQSDTWVCGTKPGRAGMPDIDIRGFLFDNTYVTNNSEGCPVPSLCDYDHTMCPFDGQCS